MSKSDLEVEIASGRFPPCILLKILYTIPDEKRRKAALMKVHVHGANVPLVFCCRVKEEMSECGRHECSFRVNCGIGAFMAIAIL